MTLFDHLYVFLLAIAYPVAGYLSFRRLLGRIAAGDKIERAKLYGATMIGHWLLLALALLLWLTQQRDWPSLGFGLRIDGWWLLAAAVTLAAIVLLVLQVRLVAATGAAALRKIRAQFGKLDFFLPRNGNELGRFYALSLTAGVVEEILWRGFLIWYLGQWLPLWLAALISTLGFGIAHAYQGFANVPKITLVGAALAGLYLLSGSIWLSIVLHAAVDMLQGRMAYEIVQRTPGDGPDAHDASAIEAQAKT